MRTFSVGLALLMALIFALVATGMRINATCSFPIGIYWVVGNHPKKGDLVFVRVDGIQIDENRGYTNVLWSPVRHLIKRLVGVAGDVVISDTSGVEVNGVHIANSAPLLKDGSSRELQAWTVSDYVIRPEEVLIMSDANPNSFDSRYFGPVPKSTIESVVVPVWTL